MRRLAPLILATTFLLALAGHVHHRTRLVEALEPTTRQLEALRAQVEADDAWLSRNTRIMEGYAQHQEYARRLALRGRRAQAYAILVEEYNRALDDIPPRLLLGPEGPLPLLGELPPVPGR